MAIVGIGVFFKTKSYKGLISVFIDWREDDDDYEGQGHRRNMLSADFDAIGMGHVYSNGVHYWAMELGNVSSAGDAVIILLLLYCSYLFGRDIFLHSS